MELKSVSPSLISLDPQHVRFDKKAKSLSFFCKHHPVLINQHLIEELKDFSKNNGSRNARICLHFRPDASFHEMVILEYSGRYYCPHRHRFKGESYHLIEGSLGVFVFDNRGKVIDASVLTPKKNMIYRVGEKMYHMIMPLSTYVIYHESKPGPFLGEQDSEFAAWAPDPVDSKKVSLFLSTLKSHLHEHI